MTERHNESCVVLPETIAMHSKTPDCIHSLVFAYQIELRFLFAFDVPALHVSIHRFSDLL